MYIPKQRPISLSRVMFDKNRRMSDIASSIEGKASQYDSVK